MARPATTVGQLLVNEVLPEDMRNYDRVLDKHAVSKLLSEVAQKHPDKYRDISFKLNQLGREAAYRGGGNSFGLQALKMSLLAKQNRLTLNKQINSLLDDDSIDDKKREEEIQKLVGDTVNGEREGIFKESLAEQNPLALQLLGAGRGNKINLAGLRGSDGLYQDHRGHIIPVPVLRSYSQGLSPLEYWASTYGARQGVLATKFAVSDAGFFSKQLNQIAHRLLVTADDREGDSPTLQGLPVETDDSDNEGALLAKDFGPYKRNTMLTPKILHHLKGMGLNRILVRSPAVSGSADGGVYAKDVGMREHGRLPTVGEAVGMVAAQALGEPLSQGMLSAKHGGGVAGTSKSVFGFDYLNQLIQVPSTFKGGAAHAQLDGKVAAVEPAPAGGSYVVIGNQKHYVGKGFEPKVKAGDEVEAGDVISEGMPNPSEIAKFKGIGEGRRYFVNTFRAGMRDMGLRSDRRNVELLARGLLNHVTLNGEVGEYSPDDLVSYSQLEHIYEPRQGARTTVPRGALGKYLERPYLHYTIGTKVRPSMLKDFDEFGVKSIDVHDDPPPFEPDMLRGMSNLQHDPDWMTRMFGSYLKSGLLPAVHHGGTSREDSTSFVPSLAKGVNFGHVGPLANLSSTPVPTVPQPKKPKVLK